MIKINRNTITVKCDSVYTYELNRFVYSKEKTLKKAISIDILLGGFNPNREHFKEKNRNEIKKLMEEQEILIDKMKYLLK